MWHVWRKGKRDTGGKLREVGKLDIGLEKSILLKCILNE